MPEGCLCVLCLVILSFVIIRSPRGGEGRSRLGLGGREMLWGPWQLSSRLVSACALAKPLLEGSAGQHTRLRPESADPALGPGSASSTWMHEWPQEASVLLHLLVKSVFRSCFYQLDRCLAQFLVCKYCVNGRFLPGVLENEK